MFKTVSTNSDKSDLKLIAMYFPQFHAIPENDEWWGKGFTDWVNVKKAGPQFEGHYQPRKPLNGNYYDQSHVETLRWQIDLAKQHGLYGFCHYHYWFDGKQLLETPTGLMLDNKDLDFPFCLSWANETWSKRWDGRNHHILIKQKHPPTRSSWQKHFDYLIRAWIDERAIKIDGKPVFVIYRPHRIPESERMLDFWREKALEHGLKGVYFIAQKQHEFPSRDCLKGFDAIFKFQPFEAINSSILRQSERKTRWFHVVRGLPEPILEMLRSLRASFVTKSTFYEYDTVWKTILEERPDPELTTFSGAFVDWDNTARYKQRATIFRGANPERFQYWFDQLAEQVTASAQKEKMIFLNAWNEWAESTYLEPDERYGYGYLEAIRKVISKPSLKRE